MQEPTIRVLEGPRVQVLARQVDDTAPVLDRIGQYLIRLGREAFTQQSFGGKAWAATTTPNYALIVRKLDRGVFDTRDLTRSRPALVDTGALRDSLFYRVLGRKTVEVGSLLPYAALHQHGGASTVPVTASARNNLRDLLRIAPRLRDDLGWLFRRSAITVQVRARPFLGVPDAARAALKGMVREHIVPARGGRR